MKPLTELYPNPEDWKWGPSIGYHELIESMGYEVIASEAIGSYQGDYLFLLTDEQRIGFLTFGYGSCSGCDSLQACDSAEETENLRESLHNGIFWGTKEEVIAHLKGRDQGNEWWMNDHEGQVVRTKFIALLEDS